MVADIEPPEFGWLRLSICVWVTDAHLRKCETIQTPGTLDSRSLDQDSVPQVATLSGFFVSIDERAICSEKIDGWTRRFMHTMAGCGHESPTIPIPMSREIVFEILSALVPVEMSEQGFVPAAQLVEAFDGTRANDHTSLGPNAQFRAVATVMPPSVTATATTHLRASLHVVSV